MDLTTFGIVQRLPGGNDFLAARYGVLYPNQSNIIFLFSFSVPAQLERELKCRGLVQTAKT